MRPRSHRTPAKETYYAFFALTGPSLYFQVGTGDGPIDATIDGILDPGFYRLNTRLSAREEAHRGASIAQGPSNASYLLQLSPAAEDVEWFEPSGGLFSEGDNWDRGVPPDENDRAIFDFDTDFPVSFSSSVENTSFEINSGSPTFDLDGNNYYLNSGAKVQSAGLTVIDGFLNIDDLLEVSASEVLVDLGALVDADTLVVSNGSEIFVSASSSLRGLQTFTVVGGSTVSNGAKTSKTTC